MYMYLNISLSLLDISANIYANIQVILVCHVKVYFISITAT